MATEELIDRYNIEIVFKSGAKISLWNYEEFKCTYQEVSWKQGDFGHPAMLRCDPEQITCVTYKPVKLTKDGKLPKPNFFQPD